MEESIRLPAEWAGWRLTEWIGGGSYGDVYEAEFHQQDDFDPGRKAAIKIIRIPRDDAEAAVLAHEIPDPSARSRYLEDLAGHLLMEIRTMDLLKDHPHAVAYQDSYVDHTEDGLSWTIYLRMELLIKLTGHGCFNSDLRNETLRCFHVFQNGIGCIRTDQYRRQGSQRHRQHEVHA